MRDENRISYLLILRLPVQRKADLQGKRFDSIDVPSHLGTCACNLTFRCGNQGHKPQDLFDTNVQQNGLGGVLAT